MFCIYCYAVWRKLTFFPAAFLYRNILKIIIIRNTKCVGHHWQLQNNSRRGLSVNQKTSLSEAWSCHNIMSYIYCRHYRCNSQPSIAGWMNEWITTLICSSYCHDSVLECNCKSEKIKLVKVDGWDAVRPPTLDYHNLLELYAGNKAVLSLVRPVVAVCKHYMVSAKTTIVTMTLIHDANQTWTKILLRMDLTSKTGL